MDVKGVSSKIVKLQLEVYATILMLYDKYSFTTLHVATKKMN